MSSSRNHSVQCGERSRTVCGVVLALWIATGSASVSRAQRRDFAGQGQGQSLSAEQLVEDALKKIDEGAYPEAEAFFQRAMRLNPTVNKLKLLEGLLLSESRHSIRALGRLEDYNRTDEGTTDWRGHEAVGKIYYKSKMYRQAVGPLEKARDFAPVEVNSRSVRAEIIIMLAEVYYRLDRKDQALEASKEAAAAAPKDPEVHLRLARMGANTTENFPEARKSAHQAMRLLEDTLRDNPFDSKSYQLLRDCHLLIVQTYRVEVAAEPDDAALYLELARAYQAAAEVEHRATLLNARESAQQAVEKDPKNYDAHVFVAELEYRLGARREALDRLAEILKIQANHPGAVALKSRILSQTVRADASE